MSFQISWLSTSKNLIEEQFDQKVNMAMGSALRDFNMANKTKLDVDDSADCMGDVPYKYIELGRKPLPKESQEELKEYLQAYMACFGIDEKCSIDIFESNSNTLSPSGGSYACRITPTEIGNSKGKRKSYSCSIKTPVSNNTEFLLGVSFLSKDEYLYDKMKFMIFSSILIFLLLATVSFIILRALVKQKRITENNIDFFNNTAHELKTPLTNISLALTMLGKKYQNVKDDKYANIIRKENSKLANQIERVLFLSSMENGDYELNKQVVNLNDMIQEVVNNMQLIAEQKNGIIHFNPPNDEYELEGDYYHLSNVIKNLIDNALKYCEKDPVINIKLTEAPNHIKVSIADNGIGISKHDQNHIFEKFQRVNTGDVRNNKGFGIGLSYVKTVIEMHKGLINVNSELNKGSQFDLLIPNV